MHGFRKTLGLLLLVCFMLTGLIVSSQAEPPEHVHHYGAWQADPSAMPSCTGEGREFRECDAENCPMRFEYRPVAALGHQWGDWFVTIAATCTAQGQIQRRCSRCAAAETQQTANLGGHNWGSWAVQTPASCTQTGTSGRICAKCGETEYQTIPMLLHSWGPWTVQTPATCTQTGKSRRTCAICGITEYQAIPMLIHNWEHRLTPPTCTAVGIEEDVCTLCGQKRNTLIVPALTHSWGIFTQIQAPTCYVSGLEESTCSRCGQKRQRSIPRLEHIFGPYQTVQEASCTLPGISRRLCTLCGLEQTRVIPALQHLWGPYVPSVAATCIQTGQAISTCSRCLLQRSRVLPKISHIYGGWSVSIAASCTKKGQEQRSCTMCGRVQTRTVKARGHASDGNWVTVRQPSLRQRGLQATTCTVCGEQAKTRTFSPRGYRFDVEAYAHGPYAAQVDAGLAGLNLKLIYIDMGQQGEQSFPLVTQDGYRIGTVKTAVSGGTLNLRLIQASEPTVFHQVSIALYHSLDDLLLDRPAKNSLPLNLPVVVEGSTAILSVQMMANYYQGNENTRFHEDMLSDDGVNSYAQLAQLMSDKIKGH